MDNNTCFALYAVERGTGFAESNPEDDAYHSFLVLRDETPGKEPRIVEELHFKMQTEGLAAGQRPYLAPEVKSFDRDFSKLKTFGYIGGGADVMRPIWEKAVDLGHKLGDLHIPFDQQGATDSANCRAGVRAIIEALGLDYAPVLDYHGTRGGSDTHLVAQLPEAAFDDMPEF